jgi:cell wall-associated NlpC family hydrolase/nucleoid-associated protein YgaU
LQFRAGLARVGFHGLMVAVGLMTALTVWNGAGDRLAAQQAVTTQDDFERMLYGEDGSAEAVESLAPADEQAPSAAAPQGEPLRPLMRRVVEGDTVRSIAAEYSVSISTILASNKLDNPDLIQPGQEILIPPVEGVVADVETGETLGHLAERYGAQVEDVALANALSTDPDQVVPYERVVVPGQETAQRAIGVARRQDANEAPSASDTEVDTAAIAKPTALTYEVQDGDTVAQLSAQFGVTIWTILTANNLADPDLIRPGMRLKVMPVNGVEHEIQPGESLSDIASFYHVDLGPLIDFNGLSDPDSLRVGSRLTIPGAERMQPAYSLGAGTTVASVPAPVAAASSATSGASRPTSVAAAQRPAAQSTLAQARPPAVAQAAAPKPVAAAQAAAKPQAPAAAAKPTVAQAAPKPAAPAQAAAKPQASNTVVAAAVSVPRAISGGAGGGAVVSAAMKYLGARYVFGGTSPAGFDCSGFVWYVHKALGKNVSRGLWGQLNGGPRIPLNQLQPGDTVFFANTYMPGLSHAGIYIGGGRFVHASDESSGVKISSLSDSYWGPRYIGASRLY